MGYAVAVLLTVVMAAATIVVFIRMVREAFTEPDASELVMNLMLVAALVVLTVIPMETYEYAISPEFSLKKAEWQCTSSHGDDEDGRLCDEYRRKP